MQGSAVTIGKFDAIHLGHRQLLQELVEYGIDHQLKTVAVTFDRHPLSVLNPDAVPKPIIGPKQKAQLIAECGVSDTVTLEFTEELAHLSAEEFVRQILVEQLEAKFVIVGHGFRFGAKGEGDCARLAELGDRYGFVFKELAPFEIDGKTVSTTRIRDLLDAGEIAAANRLLGRSHLTTGVIEHGLKIGRTIGFPTANMSRDAEGYLPKDGIYAGWLQNGLIRYPAAISVGQNETFQAVPRLAEAYVLDETDLDLYDQEVSLEYVEFVRPPAKFNGVEDLVAEINRDIVKIRVILGL